MLVNGSVSGAFAYTTGRASGRSMAGFTSLYFSLTTLSTVGYGDIVPVAPVARLLSTVEAVVGMIFVTLLIARLVSVFSSWERSGTP